MNDDTVTCTSCGAQIPRNARFCPECGQVNAAASTAASLPGDTAQENTASADFLAPYRSASSTDSGTGSTGSSTDMGSPTINISDSTARVDEAETPAQEMSASAPTPYKSDAAEEAAGATAAAGAASYSPYSAPAPTPPQGQPTQYIPPAQGGYTPPAYTPPSQAYAQQANPASTQNLNVYPGAQPPATTPSSSYPPTYSQNPVNSYQYQQQVGVAGIAPKDPTVALLLELIGYVGFLGIGHIYAGRITRGVVLMIGWWLYWGIVGVLFATILLSPVACIMAIAWPLVPILSGLWVRNDLITNGPVVQSRF